MTTNIFPPVRAFRRDIADRSFLVIGAAVIIAVASVTAVNTFTDRVRTALIRQSSALLAADLAIISNSVLADEYVSRAKSLNLRTTQTLALRSVVTFGENLQLAELKAVADTYPLRGEVLIAERPFAESNPTTEIPAPTTVWVEARLLSLIGAAVGDSIGVGAAQLKISKILVLEPDRGGDLFNIAPRVMLNINDIAKTGLIAPASRVRYSLLVAGQPDAVEEYRSELTLRAGEKVLSPQSARPEIRNALGRAEQYLGLASLTTIILAGIAIALGARSFSSQHRDTVALLRTLGATRQYVLCYFLIEVLLLGLLTAFIGATIGLVAQEVIAQSMVGWTQAELPPATLAPAVPAAAIALVALGGFALPPLMNLRNVPPLRVLRSDVDAAPTSKSAVVIYALAAITLLVPWREGDIQITLWSLIGLTACFTMLIVAAFTTIKIISRLPSRTNLMWRFGIANVARRGVLTSVQIVAIGLGLMALLVLGIIRNDLLDDWLTSLPEDAPNQFLINIQAEDVAALGAFFTHHDLQPPQFYAMIRARLIAINERSISPESYTDPRARRLVEREFNLSSAAGLKPHNLVVAGQWWNDRPEAEQFSVEQDIAKTLGITVGDSLTYRVAEREIRGVVTNLRAVRWESMQVNFFVESPPALLENLPSTFITSFHLNAESYPILTELVQRFPSVTVIDVAALLTHIRSIMDRSVAAIEFVFLFTVIAGMLVLIAAVQATQDERVFESALLKTLGAKRGLTLRIMSAEFITIGFIAGAVAGAMALLSGWLVATRVLEIDYALNPWVIAIGILAGVVGVSLVGSMAVFNALRRPAAVVLNYRG